ncbi:MAG: hypothetical protein GXY32_11640 [Ruminococcaceae bacterium]|nr:hypothetical protein [Oscillospiraceae bacterium]
MDFAPLTGMTPAYNTTGTAATGMAPASASAAPAAAYSPAATAAPAAAGPTAHMPVASADSAAQANGDATNLAAERAEAKIMNDRFNETCRTCKERRYTDGSNDAGVSFKTPQHIDPGASASVVSAHEQEHVTREQAKAQREGAKVVSQSVVLHGAICPECGRYYIAGGTTTTVTKSGGKSQPEPQEGRLDTTA